MAGFLYRLGRFSFRRKWFVAGGALLVLIVMGVAAATMAKPTSDAFSIPGIPAEKAMDLMDERFPGAGRGMALDAPTARFVFAAPNGQTLDDPENLAAVESVIDKIKTLPQLSASVAATVTNPVTASAAQMAVAQANAALPANQRNPEVPSPQNLSALLPLNIEATDSFPAHSVAYTTVTFDVDSATDITDATREAIEDAVQVGRDAGLTVYAGGTAAVAPPGESHAELIGIAVAALVLALTFGSLVAAGLPILTALIGVAMGSLGITAATGIWELSSVTPILAMMIGLAVAIDYALFIVSRYKQELDLTDSREEAAGRAVGTAGSAVVFAGMTVFIALVALSVVRIPFLTAMGLAAAFAVMMAVIIAITLLPAILGIFGTKVFALRIPGLGGDPGPPEKSPAVKYARLLARIPVVALILGVAVLAVLAVPALKLDLALPGDGTAEPGSAQREAYNLVSEGFGGGQNGPLIVVVDAIDVAATERTAAFAAVVAKIASEPDVQNVQVVNINQTGDTAMIQVIPESGPSEPATQQLVNAIRDSEGALTEATGITLGVTGQTAIEDDVSARLMASLLPYLLIVVGLAFILLMLVFRSILVPLTAALGFLLSIAATFGVTVALFQEGALGLVGNPQPIVSFLPIFLIGVVFGLAMDYQVFLVTRMREYHVHGATPIEAVVKGFHHGSRVVVAAAVIMIAVFASFMTQPDSLVKSIGFALAAAVVFDAFIVRMLIIPSVMVLMGEAAWWLPKWLDKLLPDIDIEGEALLETSPVKLKKPEPITSGRPPL
ncbi:MMPL family transporter [Rhodococcus marinonascens]|uniref:MMPL family transporter n=1 Tax=Rhodococcus marinonascens TaxID=38311 RepID=UPI0009346C20|nr:MMPL family transporter [Rhodococcus marinonascens]